MAKKQQKKTAQKAGSKKPAAKAPARAKKRTTTLWFGPNYRLEVTLTPLNKKVKKKTTKKSNVKPRKKAALFIIAGLLGASYFVSNVFSDPQPPIVFSAPAPIFEPEDVKEPAIKSLSASRPTALKIESVGIDTGLTTVGRNSDGTLTVPKEFDQAGWYEYSPTPGELGPAIITGHVDSYKGPAVFWKLGQVKPGDSVLISRIDGTVVTFIVDQVKQFDQSNFPTDEVYGNIDYVGLRLITCGGVYNRSSQSYSHNTVVYARLAE